METRKKKKISNIIMIAVIAVIVVCGITAVGFLKGWFGGGSGDMTAAEVTGIVNLERSSVAYTLEENSEIKAGDLIETRSGASVVIDAGENTYAVSESSQIIFDGAGKSVSLQLEIGEAFAAVGDSSRFGSMDAGGYEIIPDGKTVFSANVQKGSMGVRVLEGKVELTDGTRTKSAEAGQEISAVGKELTVEKLQAYNLNDFNISRIKNTSGDFELCFSSDELDKVAADRQKEIEKAQQELSANNGAVITAGSTSSDKDNTVKTCTISIKCPTVLDNMSDLTKGKEKYVPSGGIILAASEVEFRDGESVFDVLKRACDAREIQLEYSYSPGYGSNYIEGINNLYEFDCGPQSGWTFKVNGWTPNYGCGACKLKGGEAIVWEYTCKGLGKDTSGGK